MRSHLQRMIQLLTGADFSDAEWPWTRVLIMSSIGALDRDLALLDTHTWNRGLHLMLLDGRGRPSFYCKARVCPPEGAQHRESEVLRYFSSRDDSRVVVPHTTVLREANTELQASRFIGGVRLDKAIPRYKRRRRTALLSRVLDAAGVLSAAASDIHVFPRHGTSFSVADEASAALGEVGALGVDCVTREVLEAALAAAAPVTASAQHGDLWPRNVVVGKNDSCWIVDLDEYGSVVVPLYDTFHLIRSADPRITAGEVGLVERLQEPDEEASSIRTLLRNAADQARLSTEQRAGCLIYYLLQFPISIYRRGAIESFWRSHRDELPAAAQLLQSSRSLHAFCERLGLVSD